MLAGGLVLALGMTGAAAMAWVGSDEPDCPDDSDAFAEIWTDVRRATMRPRVEQEYGATGEQQWAALDARVTSFSDQWEDAHHELCQRRLDRGEPEDLLGARSSCVEWDRDHLAAIALRIEQGDATSIQIATTQGIELADPGRCLEGEHVRHGVPRPRDDAKARLAARAQLCIAVAQEWVSRWEWARSERELEVCERLADGSDHLPTQAGILRVRGRTAINRGRDLESTRELITQAHEQAQRGHDLRGAYKALNYMVSVEGMMAFDLSRAQASFEAARALELVLGEHHSTDWANLRVAMARALAHDARWTEAEPLFREGHQALVDLQSPNVIDSARDLGFTLGQLGRTDEALRVLSESEPVARAVVGDDSPGLAQLWFSRAAVLGQRGTAADMRVVVELFSRSSSVFEMHQVPVSHRAAANANMGQALLDLGRVEQAERAFERAVALFEQDPRSKTPPRVILELSRASMLEVQGDLIAAEAIARRAVEWSVDHPAQEGSARRLLAHLLLEQGRLPRARSEAELAVALTRANEPRGRLKPVVVLARVRLAEGRADEAIESLRALIDQLERVQPGHVRLEEARARFQLARALARRDPADPEIRLLVRWVQDMALLGQGLHGVADLATDADALLSTLPAPSAVATLDSELP